MRWRRRSPRCDGRVSSAARPVDAHQRARVALPFLFCTLVWSSTWLAIRHQIGGVPTEWSVTYRFAIAGLAMAAYAAARGTRLRLSAREHLVAIGYGIPQYALNYHAVYLAERTVTSGLVAVLFALLVAPNALLAFIFLGQRVTRAFVAGSGIALAGLVLLFAHEVQAAPAGDAALLVGIGWSLVGVLFSSIANVAQAVPAAKGVPIASLTLWGMIYGTGFNILVAWAVAGPLVIPDDPGYWAALLYLALIGSAAAFSAYLVVIRAIGPGRAAYATVLSPPLAMLLSTIFEGYRWSWPAALGGVAALAGLVVALRARAASPAR